MLYIVEVFGNIFIGWGNDDNWGIDVGAGDGMKSAMFIVAVLEKDKCIDCDCFKFSIPTSWLYLRLLLTELPSNRFYSKELTQILNRLS